MKIACRGQTLEYGTDYFLPSPFEARLLEEVSGAVADLAKDSEVSLKPIENKFEYQDQLADLMKSNVRLMARNEIAYICVESCRNCQNH